MENAVVQQIRKKITRSKFGEKGSTRLDVLACTSIRMLINNELPIDYDQLYAQVVEEVCERDMRYWFTAEETRQIQLDNVPFLCIPDIGQMVKACFHKPHTAAGEREHSMDEILGVIIDRYPYLKPSKSLKMRVSSMLSKMGYPSQHHKSGNFYVLLPKKAA